MSEKITVTYEIPAPPGGWVYDGGRKATRGNMVFNGTDWLKWWDNDESQGTYPIAIPKQQWRPATETDIGRTDARFRDDSEEEWIKGKLIHIFKRDGYGYVAVPSSNDLIAMQYCFCEVPTESTK
jgi:hypothetical protein